VGFGRTAIRASLDCFCWQVWDHHALTSSGRTLVGLLFDGKKPVDPVKKIRADFLTINLVAHFVSSAGIEIVREIEDAVDTIAVDQDQPDSEAAKALFV
jgi:hypothetical protein